jgi:subtilase family serine protease
MKKILVTNLRVITVATLIVSAVSWSEIAGAAELHPMKTTHVPEAVANGTAPLVGHLPASQRLSLAISLPLQNELQLDALLRRIYDPQSPDYHRYLSVEEFTDRSDPQRPIMQPCSVSRERTVCRLSTLRLIVWSLMSKALQQISRTHST